MANRLTSIEDKALVSTPLNGLKNAPDMSLEDCLTQAAAKDSDFAKEDLDSNVFLATMFATAKKAELPSSPLSTDQIASLHLYTQESPFYSLINSKLRAADRTTLVPIFPLLKLLLSALDLLLRQSKMVYRGVAADLHAQYKEKEKMIWWSVTSTTGNVKTLENEQFCGKSGPRTIFTIVDVPVVYIGGYSAVEIEDEYIVLPGTVLEVANIADLGSQLHMIQLKYVPSPPLVDLFRSAAQQKVEGVVETAGGQMAETAGGGSAAAGTFPLWMIDLPDDDVRAVFVKEKIDEETFERLGEKDLKELGLGMGDCKRLLKEIAVRQRVILDGATYNIEPWDNDKRKLQVDVPNSNFWPFVSEANGRQLQVWNTDSLTAQRFTVKIVGKKKYVFQSVAQPKFIVVEKDNQCQVWDQTDPQCPPHSQFELHPTPQGLPGYYRIVAHDGRQWKLNGSKCEDKLILTEHDGSDFKFHKV